MADEVSTGVFTTSLRPAFTRPWCSVSTLNLFYSLFLHFIYLLLLFLVNLLFYCVNTSYPMDNMLNRSAQTGPQKVRKRRPVFPPAGRSSHCTHQVAHRTSFLSRQPDVIASFSFDACTEYFELWNFLRFFGSVLFTFYFYFW